MNKVKIGVDIDEILAPFNDNFLIFLNKKLNTNYKVENFSSYNIEEETGHTKEEIHELLDEFSFSLEGKEMMPIFGAIESIFDLQNNDYELYAITARPVYIEKETREWIETHFSNHFKEIYHLGRSHKSEIKDINKGNLSIIKKFFRYYKSRNSCNPFRQTLESRRKSPRKYLQSKRLERDFRKN